MTPYITKEQIEQRVLALAEEVETAYPQRKTPLYLIGVLKGASFFLADLSRAIQRPVRLEFLSASSYGNERVSSGKLTITRDVSDSLLGCDALLVEDIVDTGLTVQTLAAHLKQKRPRSIRVASLLCVDGAERHADFIGFAVPKGRFVYGYGLDLEQEQRHLPDIYEVPR